MFGFKKNKKKVNLIDANNNIIKTPQEALKEEKNIEKSQYEEKIDNVLLSVSHLFEPFKDILIKTLPFTKKIIFLLDKLGLFIGFLTKKIALYIPLFLKFIKTKFFKIIIIIILLFFVLGVILSKTFSNSEYLHSLEDAIYQASGYKAEINGHIKIQFIPTLSISVENVGFYKDDYSHNTDNYYISQINADSLFLKLKILPLFLGQIVIKEIKLYNFSLNIKPISIVNEKNIISSDYQNIINTIEHNLKYTQATTQENLINNNQENNENLSETQSQPSKEYIPSNKKKSSFELLIDSLINKITLDINNLNKLSFSRGKINFLNSNNQRIFILENINANLKKQYNGKTIVNGDLILNGINTSYLFSINNNAFKLNANFNNTQDELIIEGIKNQLTNSYSGQINSKDSILNIINKFIIPIGSNINNADFKANFSISKSIFTLNNIELNLNNNMFKGSLLWDYGINNYIKININTSIGNLDSFIDYYNNTFNNTSNNFFLSTNSTILNWKNNNINLFKPDYYDINVNIDNTKINNINIDTIKLNALLTSDNQLYINNLSLNNSYNIVNIFGKANLDDKSTTLMVKSSGQIKPILQLMNFNETAIDLLNTLSNNQDEYNILTKLTTDNTKNAINFNDINGNFGTKNISKAYLMIKPLDNSYESTLNLNLNNLDFNEISNIYNKHIKNQQYKQDQDINIFGIKKNQILKVNLIAQSINYQSLIFHNGTLEIEFNQEGFNIKNFEAFSEKFGSITASMYANINVKPSIIGTLNFNNLYINLENLSQMYFTSKKLIGNVILNGKLKFNGDNFNNLFTSIDGDIDFTKEERLQFNQYNIDNITYLTISKKNQQNKNLYLINDIAGKVNITNNVILFDSASILFFDNKTEYRGGFKGSYNILNQDLQISGSMDNTQNISKQIKFNISGNVSNPKISTKNITLKIKNTNKMQNSNEQLQQSIDSNYTQSNNESSTERYVNESEETKTKRNELYEKLLEENLN